MSKREEEEKVVNWNQTTFTRRLIVIFAPLFHSAIINCVWMFFSRLRDATNDWCRIALVEHCGAANCEKREVSQPLTHDPIQNSNDIIERVWRDALVCNFSLTKWCLHAWLWLPHAAQIPYLAENKVLHTRMCDKNVEKIINVIAHFSRINSKRIGQVVTLTTAHRTVMSTKNKIKFRWWQSYLCQIKLIWIYPNISVNRRSLSL